MNLMRLFILFIIYSVIGWIVEMIFTSVTEKKVYNRGFLIGPYCPIYGVGCILITKLLTPYLERPLGLFCMSIIICSILEYFTSYFMEKIFKIRWWDYSRNKYNINGRICLETMIPFGIGGTFIMYYVNPLLTKFVDSIPNNIFTIIFVIVLIIFVTDNIISLGVVSKFSKEVKKTTKDETENIKKYLRSLMEKSKLHKRLILAFPSVKERLMNIKKGIKNER